jgi:lipoate---protein ligase
MNLAIETWLLRREDLFNQEVLFLYRNTQSVIIGRFQNPWLECDLEKMNKDNIDFSRRQSGGGAVYHDPGNTNFTFISDKKHFIREEKTELVIRALKTLGIDAEQGKRNDIYVNNRKISGSASKYSSLRVLHHGTLLINADLDALNKYLITMDYNSSSIKSKGVASIRSDVANLNEYDKSLTHDKICDAIIQTASKELNGSIAITHLSLSDLNNIREINEYYSIITNWEWLYGKTPSFTVTAPIPLRNPESEYLFTISKGIITEITYNRDISELGDLSLIENSYKNRRCDKLMQMITNDINT